MRREDFALVTLPVMDEIPDIVSIPDDIRNTFTKFNINTSDSLCPTVQTVIDILTILPDKISINLWMAFLMTEINDYQQRIKVLLTLAEECKNIPSNGDNSLEARFIRACKSLACFYNRIIEIWPLAEDKTPPLNNIERVVYDAEMVALFITPEEMVALTQALCFDDYKTSDSLYDMVSVVTQLYGYLNEMRFGSIVDFCSYFFIAEHGRWFVIERDESSLPRTINFSNIPVNFRNACFDVYINFRVQSILYLLGENNDRLYPPTEQEALSILLQYEKIKMEDDYKSKQRLKNVGPGNMYWGDSLKMVDIFFSYLQDKVKESKLVISETIPILSLPTKNKYNELVKYVIERRKYDSKFAEELNIKSTLKARCKYLETIIGWYPEPNSLSHNLNARLRKHRDTGRLNEFPTR